MKLEPLEWKGPAAREALTTSVKQSKCSFTTNSVIIISPPDLQGLRFNADAGPSRASESVLSVLSSGPLCCRHLQSANILFMPATRLTGEA